MSRNRNVVSVIGMLVFLLAGVVSLIFGATVLGKIGLFVSIAGFAFSLVAYARSRRNTAEDEEEDDEEEATPINWPLVIAWALVALFAIATILVGVFFGWLFLLPLVALCAAAIWLVCLYERIRNFFWIPVIALVVALVLLGVYGIMGSFVDDWNKAIDTLTVKTLIVEGDATVEGDAIVEGDATVEGQMQVENQTVTNQTVENQTVENQTVENQTVTNQTVENQTVENQTVENQTVTNQTVTNQTVTNQTTTPSTTTPSETTKPEETTKPDDNDEGKGGHTHSYTSVVTEPTCMGQGYTTHTCSCGHSYKDSYKGALGHSYKSTVVAPTEAAGGYTEHKCSRCGHSYKDSYTDKLEPVVTPTIKCTSSIRYGETVYVNLEGIDAANLLVSNKMFVEVEKISDSRVAITLTEDVDGYITITDSVSRVNVVIDIVA